MLRGSERVGNLIGVNEKVANCDGNDISKRSKPHYIKSGRPLAALGATRRGGVKGKNGSKKHCPFRRFLLPFFLYSPVNESSRRMRFSAD